MSSLLWVLHHAIFSSLVVAPFLGSLWNAVSLLHLRFGTRHRFLLLWSSRHFFAHFGVLFLQLSTAGPIVPFLPFSTAGCLAVSSLRYCWSWHHFFIWCEISSLWHLRHFFICRAFLWLLLCFFGHRSISSSLVASFGRVVFSFFGHRLIAILAGHCLLIIMPQPPPPLPPSPAMAAMLEALVQQAT
jgi:hypothetical protein